MNRLMMFVSVFAVACTTTIGFSQGNTLPVGEIKRKAEAGDAMAQVQYAQMLYMGQGMEKNEAEALKWYQKAADAGNPYAQVNMGLFSQNGDCGVKKDIAKAIEWYGKAAKQGNPNAHYF